MKRRDTTPPHSQSKTHPLARLATLSDNEPDDDIAEERSIRADAISMRQRITSDLAMHRRQLTPPPRPPAGPIAISDELRALDYDGLLARYANLRGNPQMRITHLALDTLSLDDLRQLVAELELEKTQS